MSLNFAMSTAIHGEGMLSSAGGDLTFEMTLFPLDTGDYDGTVTYRFSIRAINLDTVDRNVYIVDSGGTTKATITVPASTGSAGNYTFFTTTWTPTSGAELYRIKLEQTTAGSDLKVSLATWGAKLVGATKAKLFFLLNGDDNDRAADAAIRDSISTTYAFDTTGTTVGWFRYNAADWAGASVAFGLEIVGRKTSTNTGRHSYYSLFRVSDGAQVAASEIVTPSDADTTIRWLGNSGDISGDPNWTDGSDYHLRMKTDNTLSHVQEYNSWVTVTITVATKLKVFFPLGFGVAHNASDISRCRAAFDATEFSGADVRLETTANEFFGGGSNTLSLSDYGSSDGPGGSGTAKGSLVVTSTTKTWQQSASITVAGTRFGVQDVGGAGNLTEDSFVHMAVYVTSAGGLTQDAADALTALAEHATMALRVHETQTGAEVLQALADSPQTQLRVHLTLQAGDALPALADVFTPASPPTSGHISLQAGDYISPFVDSPKVATGLWWAPSMLIFANIELPDGTERVAVTHIRTPDNHWSGRLMQVGDLSRSIEVPAGLARVADGEIEIADTDLYWRGILENQLARGSKIEIRMTPASGGSIAASRRLYVGEVTDVEFPEASVRIRFTDRLFMKLDEDIPALGTSDNFTDLPGEQQSFFAPIVFGICNTSGFLGEQGAVTCVPITSDYKDWLVCRHSIGSLDTLYIKTPSDEIYQVVTTGFTVVEDTTTISGYTLTIVRFSASQAAGTGVRADVTGYPNSTGSASRDLAVNLRSLLEDFSGLAAQKFNIPAFNAATAEFSSRAWKCDGSIQSQMTWREAASRMVSSFNAAFFQDKDGLIVVKFAASSPDFSINDFEHLLRGSVQSFMPRPAVSRIDYNYGPSPDGWKGSDFVEDSDVQTAIGKSVAKPFDLHFVRDATTASDVASDILSYWGVNSHRIRFQLDAPRTLELVELASVVGVTHWGGIASGGWSDTPFLIEGISFNSRELTFTVDAVRRLNPVRTGYADLGDIANWTLMLHPGPYRVGARFFGFFKDATNAKKAVAVTSPDWGASWAEVDAAGAPTFTNNIAAMNSVRYGSTIHIAVQEGTSGRVSYHTFSLSTRKWTLTGEQVAATAGIAGVTSPNSNHPYGGIGSYAVDVAVSDNGVPCVAWASYETVADPADGSHALEAITAADYDFRRKMASIRLSPGVWSTAQRMGFDSNGRAVSTGDSHGVLVAGSNGRIHSLSTILPGGFVAATGDFIATFMNANGSVGISGDLQITSLFSFPAYFIGGRPEFDETTGILYFALKDSNAQPVVWLLVESDLVAGNYDPNGQVNKILFTRQVLSTNTCLESSAMTRRGQAHAQKVGSVVEYTWMEDVDAGQWYGVGRASYNAVKQTMTTLVMKFGGTRWVASFVGSSATQVYFQNYSERALPGDAYNEAAFLAEWS